MHLPDLDNPAPAPRKVKVRLQRRPQNGYDLEAHAPVSALADGTQDAIFGVVELKAVTVVDSGGGGFRGGGRR